jgi:hypothetical protein
MYVVINHKNVQQDFFSMITSSVKKRSIMQTYYFELALGLKVNIVILVVFSPWYSTVTNELINGFLSRLAKHSGTIVS